MWRRCRRAFSSPREAGRGCPTPDLIRGRAGEGRFSRKIPSRCSRARHPLPRRGSGEAEPIRPWGSCVALSGRSPNSAEMSGPRPSRGETACARNAAQAAGGRHVAPPVLTVVMPVRNEAPTVGLMLARWMAKLRSLDVRFEFLVYDDGSTDKTEGLLRQGARRHRELSVRTQARRGHGPTVLRGYREARGAWILQVDCDTDLPPCALDHLWSRRDEFDLLSLCRVHRQDRLPRRMLSRFSALLVRLLFGSALRDANCPFRLYRNEAICALLPYVHDAHRVPNLALAGLARYFGQRCYEHPWTPGRPSRPSSVSLARGTILAVCGAVDLIRVRLRVPMRGKAA
jgi:dolichol-phosphate mannosyltransferase